MSNDFVPVELVSPELPPRPRPWLTLTLTLAVFGAYILTQALVAGLFFAIELKKNPGLDADEWLAAMQFDGRLVAVSTVVAAAVCLPLVPLAAGWASRGAVREHLGLRMPTLAQTVLWLLALVAYLGSIHVLQWAAGEQEVPEFMREMYKSAGLTAPLIFAIVVVAPLTEELLFRGLLYGGLAPSTIGPVGAAIVSSLWWAVIHIQYDAFIIGSIFIAGLLFAAARQKTGSVVLCILLHAAMNLVATVELAVAMEGKG